MGTSAFILTNQQNYCPEKLLADSIISAYNADVMLNFHNSKNLTEDGRLLSTTLNINDKNVQENNKSFIFYVDAKDNPNIEFFDYEELDLDPNNKLCQIGFIEEMDGVEDLLFKFIYEYLSINKNDYFWMPDYDWVYTLEDLKKLNVSSLDPEWCYKNPNSL